MLKGMTGSPRVSDVAGIVCFDFSWTVVFALEDDLSSDFFVEDLDWREMERREGDFNCLERYSSLPGCNRQEKILLWLNTDFGDMSWLVYCIH